MAACANSCVFASRKLLSLSAMDPWSSSVAASSSSCAGFGHSQTSVICSASVVGGGRSDTDRRKPSSSVHVGSPATIIPDVRENVSCSSRRHRHSRHVVLAAQDDEAQITQDELAAAGASDILPSGEWPENFSLLNYEDLGRYFEPALLKPEHDPSSTVADVMTTTVRAVKATDVLENVIPSFEDVTGLPVIDSDLKCVGVITKTQAVAAPNPAELKVEDIMTAPAITVPASKTVAEAAVVMLKHRVHRLPVVNEEGQLVGIVTRTDLFTALEHPTA